MNKSMPGSEPGNEPGKGSNKSPSATGPQARTGPDQFAVRLTARFLLLAFLLATATALSTGAICHVVLLSYAAVPSGAAARGAAPARRPATRSGDAAPLLAFTTKLFRRDEGAARGSDRFDSGNDAEASSEGADDDEDEDSSDDEEEEEEEDELNDVKGDLPAGHHLLFDIKNVDPDFLRSEERLRQSMFNVMQELKVTQLSYNCHSFASRFSCVGGGLDSSVAMHAWPNSGAITLDLFLRGSEPLVSFVPAIKDAFAVPAPRDGAPEPVARWAHRLRGYRRGFGGYQPHENLHDATDLGDVFVPMDDKEWLFSEATGFQHVDVVKVDPSYDYHNPRNERDRYLFLDGTQQSTLHGEAEYHEALVHPPMLAHPGPRRVAIIGGGEGATLREVLKHRTVEEVVMVEIDRRLVEICREQLPEWSDCSDNVGSDSESCFDDSRATVVFEDAFQWFRDRFETGGREEEKFDIIIMDALDPDKLVEIVGSLYKDNSFVVSLFNSLSEEGLFVSQMGEAFSQQDPALETGPFIDTANMMAGLENVGFESLFSYDEAHSHFSAPWDFLLCFKSTKSRRNWYRTTAEIALELRRRLHRTRSGRPPLRYFDAATMENAQVTPRVNEAAYCRKEPAPRECAEMVGVPPEVARARGGDIEKPVYGPVHERRLRQVAAAGGRGALGPRGIARLPPMLREAIGEGAGARV